MNQRYQSGSSLIFIASGAFVVAVIGVFFVLITLFFGGMKQAQNSVDSSNLNVAKRALKIGIKLSDTTPVAQETFAGCVDVDGTLDLLTYNRAVAETMLIAINALDEGTLLAQEHARLVGYALQGGGSAAGVTIPARLAVANKLFEQLQDAKKSQSAFDISANNSLRHLGPKAKLKNEVGGYEVAYLEPNGPTNVYLDESILPAGRSFPYNATYNPKSGKSTYAQTHVSQTTGTKYKYMAGYTDAPILVAGSSVPGFRGVPLQPNQPPHLVSRQTFETRKKPSNLQGMVIPPNTFKSTGSAAYQLSKKQVKKLTVNSCAICGSLNVDYPASIPGGYIKIINPRGLSTAISVPEDPDTIFNDELMSGIYLVADQNGNTIGFSTDIKALEQAILSSQSGNKPISGRDQNGRPLIFGVDGLPLANTSALKFDRLQSPLSGCTAANISSVPECSALFPSFIHAYPHNQHDDSNNGTSELTAVEYFKYAVIRAYSDVAWPQWNAVYQRAIMSGQAISPQQANITVAVQAPPGYTGVRIFDRNKTYLAPPVNFTTTGSIRDILSQIIGNDAKVRGRAKKVMAELLLRIRQIKPEIKSTLDSNGIPTDPDLAGIFSAPLELNSTHYIYMDKNSRRLVISGQLPPGIKNLHELSDGVPSVVAGLPISTIPNILNPPHEIKSHDVLFYINPDRTKAGLVQDQLIWTKSSGYNGLLGSLEFRESVGPSEAVFAQPN